MQDWAGFFEVGLRATFYLRALRVSESRVSGSGMRVSQGSKDSYIKAFGPKDHTI